MGDSLPLISELFGAGAVDNSAALRAAAVDTAWRGYRFVSVDADGWLTFWRLDPRGETLSLAAWHGGKEWTNPPLWQRAATPAGVHGRWLVHGGAMTIELRGAYGADDELGRLDVLVDGAIARRHQVLPGEQTVRVALPDREAVVEVWLPQIGQVEIRAFEPGDATQPSAPAGLRWTTYGSSITQCAHASGPSETWPALVARRTDWDMLALGLGGECHLDAAARRSIERRPADLISLCMGINIWGAADFHGRTLAGQVAEFVRGIRAAQPDASMVVFSPILAPAREGVRNAVGLTLDDIRELVEKGASAVDGVTVVDGRELWSREEAERLLADEVHPGADGYRLLGDRFGAHLTRAAGAR